MPSCITGGVPERFPVFCCASLMCLIRAAHPPVVARYSLLHKDRKSLTYSLPSFEVCRYMTRVGQRGSVLCSASRSHVVNTCGLCVQNATQNARSIGPTVVPARFLLGFRFPDDAR